VHVANGGLRSHATGTPITADLEFYLHWEDENLNEMTVVTNAQALQLQEDALDSQSAFDTTAGSIASWYALSSLSSAKKAAARERARAGVARFANTPRP